MVIPIQAELTTAGFKIYILLKSRKRNKSRGTTLVVVNSVCGCAARNPGAKI
jgi:putative YphP/YqiW family bacilliredoxin